MLSHLMSLIALRSAHRLRVVGIRFVVASALRSASPRQPRVSGDQGSRASSAHTSRRLPSGAVGGILWCARTIGRRRGQTLLSSRSFFGGWKLCVWPHANLHGKGAFGKFSKGAFGKFGKGVVADAGVAQLAPAAVGVAVARARELVHGKGKGDRIAQIDRMALQRASADLPVGWQAVAILSSQTQSSPIMTLFSPQASSCCPKTARRRRINPSIIRKNQQ